MNITLDNATVYAGSNLDILPTLPDNSVDSIVTDPPYELGFMGKSWDSSGIAYSVELWRECMRVLKPGGHLLAFGGSRTWHRLAVAIEDAGFEMRDSIAWLYGSGFPKSMDISKQIDKRGGHNIGWFGSWLRTWREQKGISQKEIAALFLSKTGNLTGCVANWELGLSTPTAEQFSLICETYNLPFASIEEAEREVIGSKMSGIANKEEKDRHTIGASRAVEVDITAPATPEAQKWQGWGTALKPAFEPVVVARKPLIGTVAANVLEWGTGGLNIDASRIEGNKPSVPQPRFGVTDGVYEFGSGEGRNGEMSDNTQGRWPANIILDPYTAELLDEQSGITKSGTVKPYLRDKSNINVDFNAGLDSNTFAREGDSSGASRFFYVAKASKKDRNEGLDGLEEISAGEMVDREEGSAGMNSPRAGAGRTSGAKNFHPTVKPTALMEYLIKLVTPSNGIVLDPFTGSGSTGKAALLNGFQFIGIELTEEYLPIIEGRLKWANEQASKAEEKKDEVLF